MATTLSISGTRVIFAAGKFDSDNRYLRAGNVAADMPIPRGVTFQIDNNGTDGTIWRYSVNGYVQNFGSLTADSPYTLVIT